MSNEGIPKQILNIKERADTKLQVLEAAKNSFAETMRRFSLPIEMAFVVPDAFEEAVVMHERGEKPESIDELRARVISAAAHTLRLWNMSTPDITEFFEKEIDDRLSGQSPRDSGE